MLVKNKVQRDHFVGYCLYECSDKGGFWCLQVTPRDDRSSDDSDKGLKYKDSFTATKLTAKKSAASLSRKTSARIAKKNSHHGTTHTTKKIRSAKGTPMLKKVSSRALMAAAAADASAVDSTAATLANLAMLERRLQKYARYSPEAEKKHPEIETKPVRRMSSEKVIAAAEKAAIAKKKKSKSKVKSKTSTKMDSKTKTKRSKSRSKANGKSSSSSSKEKDKKKKKKKKKKARGFINTGVTLADLELGLPVRVYRENDVVLLGTVRFFGPTEFFKGDWVGVELDSKIGGLNDGSVQGVRYFKCAPKAGIFVRPGAIQPIV